MAVGALVAALVAGEPATAAPSNFLSGLTGWTSSGHDIANTRTNPFETKINPHTVGSLKLKWSLSTNGEVSATPTVDGGAVYFPDWAGYLTKADARTGAVLWSRPVSDYTGLPGDVSRTAPAISHGVLYLGDQGGILGAGAHVFAVNAADGRPLWSITAESHPAAVITESPLFYGGRVYVGVSSNEFGLAATPGYQCCTFRGSLVALDARTGAKVWQTYSLPDNGGLPGGYSGGSVWGGTPVVDPLHHLIFFATGNNYAVPEAAKACQLAGGTPAQCLSPDDHKDSLLAADLATGTIKWAAGPQRFDDWNAACIPGFPPNNCPQQPGPDFDFGDGPHLSFAMIGGHPREVISSGEKSGEYWQVDALTGQIMWSAVVGPGGLGGGVQWGSAVDGLRTYVAESDSMHLPYQLLNGDTISYGSFVALDPGTGRMLWQTADPSGGVDTAPLTEAGGVVFGGSMTGWMYALNAANGAVLWKFQGAGPVNSGPAVVDGTVYWGNGYPNRQAFPPVITPGHLYAFTTR